MVMLVEVDVGLDGGGLAPGESIVPANAETASATVRTEAAHVRRNLFTFRTSHKDAKIFVMTLDYNISSCKSRGECVKLASQLGNYSLQSVW